MSLESDLVGGINMSQGICNTEIPEPVRAAAKRAIDEGPNTYTRCDGIGPLREALAEKLRGDGISADPETEIVVTSGSTGAFYCACLALLEEGDEVILFEPFYGYHVNTLVAAGAVPRYVRMRGAQWTIDVDELKKAIGPRTRGIMICTPGNPTGKVWSRDELELVGRVAEERDLLIFTDEVYEYLVFDGRKHLSPASLEHLRPRTIAMFSLSKTFSITGWRLGYTVAPAAVSKMIAAMTDLVYVCAPAPLQAGVAAGLVALAGTSYYSDLRADYEAKRDMVCAAMRDGGLSPTVPEGAYYVLASMQQFAGATSRDRAMRLLRERGVACVPGSAFFHDDAGDALGRFCFAKSMEELNEACRRLRQG